MNTGSTKFFLKWKKKTLKIKSLKLRYWFSMFSIFFFKIKENCLVLFENDFGLVQNIVDLLVQIILNLEKYKTFFDKNLKSESQGMCYSHLGNGIRNGSISITKWGFINYRCKVNPVSQWGKILVMAMGFVDYLVRAQSYLKELDL